MKKFKRTRKALALLLSLSLITGMIPGTALSAFAAESSTLVDAAIVFTDAHTQESNYKESTFKAIFGALKDTGLPFSSVTSGGDAFSVNNDSGNSGFNKYTGKTSTLTGYIRTALDNDTIPVNYVWSDHDRYAVQEDGKTLIDKTSRFVYGAGADNIYGTDDDGNYYVYLLSMADLGTNDRYGAGFTSDVSSVIEKFETEAGELKQDRPLLIVSHQPLLANRGDNGNAAKWCEAINGIAEDMDVAFFFGHNHKYDNDSDFYYAKGSEMPVAQKNNDKTGTKTEINFAHMCAGYFSPKSSTSYVSDTRQGVAVAVAIYNDSINFKTVGAGSEYNGTHPLDETMVREHAVTQTPDVEGPETPTVPEGYTLNSIEVVNTGGDKYFVGTPLNTEELSVVAVYKKEGASDFRLDLAKDAYTISGYNADKVGKQHVTVNYEGLLAGFTVEVFQKTFTNDAGDVSVAFDAYGITSLKATSKVKDVEGYNAYVTYDITPTGYAQGTEATVTIEVDTALFDTKRPVIVLDNGTRIASPNIVDGKITFTTNHFSEYDVIQADIAGATWVTIPGEDKVIFRLADSLSSGKKYVIINKNTAGSANAVNLNGSSINSTSVTVIADSEGNYIEAPATSAQWTYTSSRFRSVASTNRYLRGNSADLVTTTSTNYTTTYITWSYSNGLRVRSSSNSGSYRYLHSDFTTDTSSSTTNRVYVFVEDTMETEPTYVTMTGQAAFNIAAGQYADSDAVIDMVKDQIHVYIATKSDKSDAEITNNYTIEGTVDPSTAKDGGYNLTVKYGDITLGNVNVNVVVKVAKDIEVDSTTFTVERDSVATTKIGTITVYYEDGESENVDLTIAMLQGTKNVNKNGTYSGLSVTYGGKTESGLTLKVVNKTGVNDFPTYPNAGSVDLKKTAKGIDFQNTGVARVELSASGLPAGGVDVAVVVDTGSSMSGSRLTAAKNAVSSMLNIFMESEDKYGTDIDVAVVGFNGFDGTDFHKIPNASLNNSYRTTADSAQVYTSSTGVTRRDLYNNSNEAVLSATDFINSSMLTANNITTLVNSISAGSGTNYDGGLASAYRLLAAKKAANTAPRQQFVIFLSDGAGFLYNGFMSSNSASDGTSDGRDTFNRWLTGEWKTVEDLKAAINNNEFNYRTNGYDKEALLKRAEFYNGNGTNHPHRIAEAIKGEVGKDYTVVRSEADPDNNYMEQWAGLGAKIYSIGLEMKDDSNDGTVTVDTLKEVINVISSGDGYGYPDATEAQLSTVFDAIAQEINIAASNARFVDQMGSSFNLQMNPSVKTNATGEYTNVSTDITVTTHPVYLAAQVGQVINGHTVTTSDVGKPYGNGNPVETVKFAVNGSKITATTNVGGYQVNGTTVVANQTNILIDDVLYGKNFFYNNSKTEKTITLSDGTTYKLPAETFYWNIGSINEMQYTLAYTVYLDGALDGKTPASGSYETNNSAILYYTNHVGNEVSKSVSSPTIAWQGAQVSYAFYLVNDKGEPVHADGTVATNFLQAHKLTQPVVYKTINLNTETSISAAAVAVLPAGYALYSPEASYTIDIASGDGQGANINKWTISGDASKTTYVMGYSDDTSAYSNLQNVQDESYNYTDTIVYFAVRWTVGAIPDTVVIDYGLDVEVNVMANDMFGKHGSLELVGKSANKPTSHTTDSASGFAKSVKGDFGTATVQGDKVRYSLNKDKVDAAGNEVYTKGMQMNDAEKLAYAAFYDGSTGTNNGYYYGDLTVIPATTVYYEDEYVSLKTYVKDSTVEGGYRITDGWTTSSKKATALQGEDRPGQFNLGTIDANNIYGFDGAYTDMSTFSMDNAAMMHVDANQYGTAEFEFYGTGFDIISSTSNTTGTLAVKVVAAEDIMSGETLVYGAGDKVKATMVDTYYGYEYGFYYVSYKKIDGVWEMTNVGDPADPSLGEQTKENLVDTGNGTGTIRQYAWKPLNNSQDNINDGVINDPSTLYQVPAMKVENLPYGKYKVLITATYFSAYDSTYEPGYDLYLDAIRIYNPAGTTSAQLGTTIEDAYKADGEYNPSIQEVRNLLIRASAIKNLSNEESVNGIIFIDGNEALSDDTAILDDAVTDYISYGPNNELYLAKGQAVAFDLRAPSETDYDTIVRIGMKTVGEKSAMAELWNAGANGAKYNTISDSIDTATDMYYDITPLNNGTVVITNTGEAGSILSVTNVKVTYKPIVVSAAGLSENNAIKHEMFSVSKTTVNAALMSLRPLTSDNTDTPTVPDTPVTPEQPDTPVVPDTPVTPEQPDTPVVPDKPEADEPEGDKPAVDQPEPEKPAADPAKIVSVKTDKKTYTQGDKVKVTVTTNSAATKVKVGTKTLKTFKTTKGNKTWTTTVKASKIGKLSISAVAYNKEGTATKKVTKKVTVKQFAPKKFNVTLSKSKVKKGAKYTVTVKTSTNVKYVKVNGKKITKFTTDKKKTTRTFKVTYKATKLGKKTVKVVSYNNAGYGSKAKSKTVTVKRK